MGFDECENPVIVEENDIYRQFGPEAMAVLDRVFYLGGLPRPNVGIAKKQLDEINEILQSHKSPLVHGHPVPAGEGGHTGFQPMTKETEERLRETLHAYKKSEIDGDELTFELAKVLGVDDGIVVHILDAVFPEFRSLVPESSRSTLRSHMTSGWFLTLGSIWERTPLPIRLFSVEPLLPARAGRGPDPAHDLPFRVLRGCRRGCHHRGRQGRERGAPLSVRYEDFRFQPDEKRSKYYMPDSQTEVYAKHPVHGWVEVATFGMYSPSALGEYGIGVPVMNLGLGVERLAMIASMQTTCARLRIPSSSPAAYRPGDRTRRTPQGGAGSAGRKVTRARDCAGRGSECHGTGALLL